MLFSQYIDTRAYTKQTATWKHYLLPHELFKSLLLTTTFNGLLDYSGLKLRNFNKERDWWLLFLCWKFFSSHNLFASQWNYTTRYFIMDAVYWILIWSVVPQNLSFMVWISKKQYFIIRNQPSFLFHAVCSNLFLDNKLLFYNIIPNLTIIWFWSSW